MCGAARAAPVRSAAPTPPLRVILPVRLCRAAGRLFLLLGSSSLEVRRGRQRGLTVLTRLTVPTGPSHAHSTHSFCSSSVFEDAALREAGVRRPTGTCD